MRQKNKGLKFGVQALRDYWQIYVELKHK